jgi:Fe-Mn family superoxide dismutase
VTHRLPDLPYDYDALEPYVDERTMHVHHDKHHQAYINNLNKALEGYEDLQKKSAIALLLDLDEVPDSIRTAVRNNAGGHAAHTMFWKCMSPDGGGEPDGALAGAIEESFGSFGAFQTAFNKAAATYFGSGWIWLCADTDGKLQITTTPGHDNPVMDGLMPLLVLDVWEHAYYLKYENWRAEFIEAWWSVVDWDTVSASLTASKITSSIGKVADWAQDTWNKLEEGLSKLGNS